MQKHYLLALVLVSQVSWSQSENKKSDLPKLTSEQIEAYKKLLAEQAKASQSAKMGNPYGFGWVMVQSS